MRQAARRWAALWLATCVMALGVTAFVATSAGAKSSRPAAPEGYHVVTLKAAGLRMAVPDTWLALDPSSPTFDRIVTLASQTNPDLAPLIAQFNAVAADTSFMAIDQSGTRFASNLIVSPTALSKITLSQPALVEAGLRQALATLKPESLHVTKTKVDGRSSLLSTATLTVAGLDGNPMSATSRSYYVPTKKGVVQLTFTTAADGSQDATVQTMVDSLKIT